MSEMARVLAPGGRVSLNVWGALDQQVFHAAFVDGIAAFFGADARTALDVGFSLNKAEELRRLANDVGMKDIKIRFEHRTMRHPSAAEMAAGFMQATRVAGQFKALPEDERTAFVEHVCGRLSGYIDDAGLAAPLENHFLTATR